MEDGVGLGMTRLAIIDVAGGHQPMPNEDKSLWIVFNGEIYNHRELRRVLEARGHSFQSRCDTEAILHLYEEEGEDCVQRLRGMFAFAIWDASRKTLFLARDRMGKKPLYYWHGSDLFLFASEIKALLLHPAVPRKVDWEALHHYLAFGYTPAGRSIFAGIRKIPPAHAAVVKAGRFILREYWRLPTEPRQLRLKPPEIARMVREQVCEAVRLRLESDVPLGVFLSGGMDSSSVVACMREVTGGRIATFSIGFGRETASFDELPFARLVAQRFETDHTEEVLEPKVTDLLPLLIRHFDEPFADSSAVPTFAVAKATSRHVKVALSGIGGDEAFAGYPRYMGLRLSEQYARLPNWLRTVPRVLVPRLLLESETSRNYGDWARRFLLGSDLPSPDRYIGWTCFFGEQDLASLVTADLQAEFRRRADERQRELYSGCVADNPIDGAFRIDMGTYLPDDLLTMADRMSMAHGLEVRAPFCDHRLVESSLTIPPRVKMRHFQLKSLLKMAFADMLPADLMSRPKQGFMIPLARWLRSDLRPMMGDLLSGPQVRARGLFQPTTVERLKKEHLEGRRAHGDRLWTLLVLELWMREYLDAPPSTIG